MGISSAKPSTGYYYFEETHQCTTQATFESISFSQLNVNLFGYKAVL